MGRLKRIAAEIDRMAPAILSVEPVAGGRGPGGNVGADTPRWLHWLARRHGGKLYLFAANDGDGEGVAQFILPVAPRSIRVLGEDRHVRMDGAAFQDDFRRLSVHLYEVELPPQ